MIDANDAREALEPLIQQMVRALVDGDDDLGAENREASLLTGWVLVTSSVWPSSEGEGTGSTVRITPRDGQADHVTVGLLRVGEQLMHHS